MVAVRELLQNAFDAVREQLAYTRLGQPDPNRADLEQELGTQNRVDLRFEAIDGTHWLICTDTGVGMTKAIIRDHFLVSGTARRHDLLALERRCKQAGFLLGRTGEFGFGALTYFMLADQVILRTRRGPGPKDADPTGWYFESEGIGSFGELKRDSSREAGTEVRLRLRREIVQEPAAFFHRLSSYVSDALIHIPCEFRLTTDLTGVAGIDSPPGWAGPPRERTLLAGLEPERDSEERPEHLISHDSRLSLAEEKEAWADVRDRATQLVRWVEDEGDLPDGLGGFRIRLPYFDLPGGACLAPLRTTQVKSRILIDWIPSRQGWLPNYERSISWKGMRTCIGIPI
jgi:hypothetical protein